MQCTHCQIDKPLSEFYVRKESGLPRKDCKSCNMAGSKRRAQSPAIKQFQKEYAKKNAEKLKEYRAQYYVENKEHLTSENRKRWHKNSEQNRANTRRYYQENKQNLLKKQYAYYKKKYHSDPIFNLKCRLLSRLSTALRAKQWKKDTSFAKTIGCSLEEFKVHIESKFLQGMTWENKGTWHLDHIIPSSSASTKDELYKLSHYTNFQPLWARDNILKSNKMPMTDSVTGDSQCL